MIQDEQWWKDACEAADRITARQIGVPRHIAKLAPIEQVRAAVAKKMAPSASQH